VKGGAVSDADCGYFLETQRQRRQKCCKYEPPFDDPDNIMFHTASNDIMHGPNEFCAEDFPHGVNSCGFWAKLDAESALSSAK
jgi:hypothetical protein